MSKGNRMTRSRTNRSGPHAARTDRAGLSPRALGAEGLSGPAGTPTAMRTETTRP